MGKAVSTPLKQARLDGNWDAVVIGSGIGGLTAAALLSMHGDKRVLVLERHYLAGGFTHSFSRPGFTWDVGVHYIGDVKDPSMQLRRAFDHLTEGNLKWAPMPEIYDRIVIAGDSYEFVAGIDFFRSGLVERFPREERAIDGYLAAILACNRAGLFYNIEKSIPAPVAAMLGGLLRRGFLHWAGQTTRQVLDELGVSAELAGVLTAQWGDYGLTPTESSFAIHATIAAHYFSGASYPVGGSERIAASIVPQIERAGGMVVTSAEVRRILLGNHRVRGVELADGQVIESPLVISDAGAGNTFFRLLPGDLPEMEKVRAGLLQLSPSRAHINLYAGLDGSSAELGLTGTNLWLYPGYDHDASLSCFQTNPDAPLPVAFISFPSAKDPEFELRHPGHATAEIMVPFPFANFARWSETRWMKRGADYDSLKQYWTERLTDLLTTQYPQLAGRIAHAEISTPLSTRHFMNHPQGEIYGIAATPARYRMRELGARTPIRGLLLTGADVAGAGVAGVLYGGVIAASLALRRNLFGVVHKPLSRFQG
ncbi:phytoene desaturase family protein [Telmatobacter bradus]|uniref:phytoene desaturase family protein n=1 Tax=Telmatobacter bradus TaxID=474953 RepID=UPI003B430FC8